MGKYCRSWYVRPSKGRLRGAKDWICWLPDDVLRCGEVCVNVRYGKCFVEFFIRVLGQPYWRLLGVLANEELIHVEGPVEEFVEMKFLSRAKAEAARPGASPVQDARFQKEYPALFEYCTSTTWEDGKTSRIPCSLTVYAEDGQWKMCLGERNIDATLWSTSDTFLGALGQLEERLTAERVDWRPKRQAKPSRKS